MYVGQTCQRPKTRWRRNRRGYRPEGYFGKAINKYGWSNFEHEIVASNLTKEEADNFEILLIAKLDTTNPKKGYNLSSGGGGSFGIIRSQEYREKQSKAQKGKKMSEESKQLISQNSPRRNGAVLQLTKNGELVKEWDCAETVRRELGITHVSAVCRGKRKTAGGYIWKLK